MPDRPWRFDERLGRFRAPNGRLVSFSTVRDSIDKALDNAEREVRLLALQLQRREISLVEFELRMRQQVKDISLWSGASAKGGWAQLSPSDLGAVGRHVRAEYAFVRRLSNEIRSGKQRIDGTLLRRVGMYAKSGRQLYERTQRQEQEIRGADFERNQLFSGDSCPGCLAASAAGWVPIGTLPLPGKRDCLSQCRCALRFFNSALGELPAVAA